VAKSIGNEIHCFAQFAASVFVDYLFTFLWKTMISISQVLKAFKNIQ